MCRTALPLSAFLVAAVLPIVAAAGEPAAAKPRENTTMLSPQSIAARIRKHRTAEATLTLTTASGRPLADQAVTVRQTRHKFLFGSNAFRIDPSDTVQLQRDYQKRFGELLNFGTLPFYWGSYERQRGQTVARRIRAMAEWCRDNGIRTKGHPLCWHTVSPKWAGELTVDEVHRLQLARITREVKGFAGLIDTWDVVNEAVIMPDFRGDKNPITPLCRKLGRVELIKQTFAAAGAANSEATLLLNDYDTSPKYEALIRDCLAAGVKIDTIGIQSHMHGGYWGAKRAWQVCERFARFGKPLHFTELTLISGAMKKSIRWHGPRYDDWASTPEGEKRQAEQVAEFYTVLFSHPAVEAITWWDFSDHSAWLGAPSGLVRKDMSPKPAYERLMSLVKKKWWTGERKLTTDSAGRVKLRGFLGDYAVESGAGKGTFRLDKAGKAAVRAVVK
jgi:endo-1,4-beta-xylanase